MVDLALIAGPEVSPILEDETEQELFSTEGFRRMNPDNISKQAVKAHIALGEKSPGIDPLTEEIAANGEENIRAQLSVEQSIAFRQQKLKMIEEMAEARKGQPMSPEEQDFIMEMTTDTYVNDGTILEKMYAENVMKLGARNAENEVYNGALEEDADSANFMSDFGEGMIAKYELVQNLLEKEREEVKESGIADQLWNTAETFIPYLQAWQQMDYDKSWMPGDNIQEQMVNLHLLSPDEFQAKIVEKYTEIRERNPLSAIRFLESYLSYSKTQQFFDNAWAVVDVTTILGGPLLKGGLKAIRGAGKPKPAVGGRVVNKNAYRHVRAPEVKIKGVEFKDQVEDTVKAVSTPDPDPGDVLAATGHTEESVMYNTMREVRERQMATPDLGESKSTVATLSKMLNSFYNPRAFFDRGSRLTREAKDRLVEGLNDATGLVYQMLHNPSMAVRLTDAALRQGIEETKLKLQGLYRTANDHVIDSMWSVRRQEDNAAHVNELTMYLGDESGMGFKTPEDAIQTAEQKLGIRPDDYEVVQQANKSYITVTRPIDEADISVRKAMLETSNETPKGFWNTVLGMVRNPDDTLSPFSVQNRKAVTQVGSEIQRLFGEIGEPITQLSKAEKSRLSRLMAANRDFQQGSERGKFFETVSEMEDFYHRQNGFYPSEKEVAAYFRTRFLSDTDWMVRSLAIYRGMSAQGITSISIPMPSGLKSTVSTSSRQILEPGIGHTWVVNDDVVAKTNIQGTIQPGLGYQNVVHGTSRGNAEFYGKVIKALPEDDKENYGVYLIEPGQNRGSYVRRREMNWDDYARKISEEGYKIVQVANPAENPFQAFDDVNDVVNFVVVKNFNETRIKPEKMLPYKPGYHVDYAPGFFSKQPKFYYTKNGQRVYSGETSIMYHVSEAAAKKYHKALDHARLLLKSERHDELRAYLRANLPHSYEHFTKLFKDTLDVNTPVIYTKSGQSAHDAIRSHHGEHIRLFDNTDNVVDSRYNLMEGVNRQYIAEKNLALPSATEGSEFNPVHKFIPAKLIDPLQSLSRSAHAMIKMRSYDNYQIQQLNSFIEEFGNPANGGSVMKRSVEVMRANPLSVIKDPMWDEKVIDKSRLAAAHNVHRALTNLLNVRSMTSQKLDWMRSKIVDSISERWGEEIAGAWSPYVLAQTADPLRYIRGIAFHTKLGLFNPVQYWLQSQSVLHGMAITGNPKRVLKAAAGAIYMRRLSLATSPKIVEDFAERATKFGWTKSDFIESFENMRATGLWNIEGEVIQVDDVMENSIFQGKTKAFLNKGQLFFKEGERNVRLNSWNIAYLEWRKANPTKVMDTRARNEVLARYDDLAINMTRSSAAQYQRGLLSLPTQFTSYYVRIMEQMLGKRLTRNEKARLVAMYSTIYGVPTGTAVGLPGGALWPWGEDMKQHGLENGEDISNGWLEVAMNGLLASGVELVTGREYNVSERYGPGGLTFLKETIKGRKNAIEILLGPSGSILNDIIQTSDPVFRWAMGAFQGGDGQSETYPLLVEDIAGVFRNVSSLNQAYKMIYALNTGKFTAKNGLYTTDADGVDAIMQGVFGLEPRELTETYIMLESMSEFNDAQRHAKNQIATNYRRATEYAPGSDEFNRYMRAVRVWLVAGGFRPDQYAGLIDEIFDGDDSLVEKIERQWVTRAPEGEMTDRLEQIQQRNK